MNIAASPRTNPHYNTAEWKEIENTESRAHKLRERADKLSRLIIRASTIRPAKNAFKYNDSRMRKSSGPHDLIRM